MPVRAPRPAPDSRASSTGTRSFIISAITSLLLSRPDRVGDVILATACLAPVRAQLGTGARLFFAARETMRPLLDGHPLLDGFVSLDQEPAALTAALAACRVEALAHLHPDAACQLAGAAAGIPRRLGYRQRWWLDRRTLTDRLPDDRRAGARHEAEYNFDLLAPLGLRAPPLAELRPSVHLDERSRESLAVRLRAASFDPAARPFVVLNPTAFSLPLRWPAEAFARLAERIRRELDLAVVLIAPDADDPSIVRMRRELGAALVGPGGGVCDLSGGMHLGEIGWLLRAARALVSRNTGTSHLAAAVGCPVVELFGRLEPIYGPGRWRALAEPGRAAVVLARPEPRRRWETKRAFWQRSFAAIDEEEVFTALRRLLEP